MFLIDVLEDEIAVFTMAAVITMCVCFLIWRSN